MNKPSQVRKINSEDLAEKLIIKKGLSENQINQLIYYSNTDQGLKFTSDAKRFKDRKGFDEFSTHILAYYVLIDNQDNLLGIIWFDDLPLPQVRGLEVKDPRKYKVSYAIRLYDKARGKGLAVPFTKIALQDFLSAISHQPSANNGIWLAVSPENSSAIPTYEKVGFKKIGLNEAKTKLIMVLNE